VKLFLGNVFFVTYKQSYPKQQKTKTKTKNKCNLSFETEVYVL